MGDTEDYQFANASESSDLTTLSWLAEDAHAKPAPGRTRPAPPPQNGSQNLAGSLQPKEPATQGALRLAGQQPSTRWATPTQFCQGVASSFALQGLMSELQPRIVGMMGQARLRAHCWLCMQSAMALPCAVAAACRGGRQRHG